MANIFSRFSAEFFFPENAYKDFVTILDAAARAIAGDQRKITIPFWWAKILEPGASDEEADSLIEKWAENPAAFAGKLLETGIESIGTCSHEWDAAKETMRVWAGSGGTSAYDVGILLSHVMEHNDIRKIIIIEEALWCDNPVPDCFHGQVFAIGPGVVLFEHTSSTGKRLAREVLERMKSGAAPSSKLGCR